VIISLLPIDVGFDIRALRMPVIINANTDSVIFKNKRNKTVNFNGSCDEIKKELKSEGFIVD